MFPKDLSDNKIKLLVARMDYPVSVSVVMPTYNTPLFMLKVAVESVLNQTFTDFEFIIVDDGSTNESVDYLRGLTDERVKVVRNRTNLGVTASLNIGLNEAKGKYIARMDADDISLPWRFEKQYRFMEANRDAIICGSNIFSFEYDAEIAPHFNADLNFLDDDYVHLADKVRDWSKEGMMDRYKIKALFANPGPYHPTIFIDHEKLTRYGLRYDEGLRYAQDYGFFVEAANWGSIYELKEPLLAKRNFASQISRACRSEQISCDKVTQKKLLCELLGNVTPEELEFHYWLARPCHFHYWLARPCHAISPEAAVWLNRLISANEKRRVYDQKAFERFVARLKEEMVCRALHAADSKWAKLRLLFRYLPLGQSVMLLTRYLYRGEL